MEINKEHLLYSQNEMFVDGNRESIHHYDEFRDNFLNSSVLSKINNIGGLTLILFCISATGSGLIAGFGQMFRGELTVFEIFALIFLSGCCYLFFLFFYKMIAIARIVFSKNPVDGLFAYAQHEGIATMGEVTEIRQTTERTKIQYSYKKPNGSQKPDVFITKSAKSVGDPVVVVYTDFFSFLL